MNITTYHLQNSTALNHSIYKYELIQFLNNRLLSDTHTVLFLVTTVLQFYSSIDKLSVILKAC